MYYFIKILPLNAFSESKEKQIKNQERRKKRENKEKKKKERKQRREDIKERWKADKKES